MESKKWAFLSNHGRVFAYVCKNPKDTIQIIAQQLGLSVRAVQNIIEDLERDGYLSHLKVGRCNHYIILPEKPRLNSLEAELAVETIAKTCSPRN
jgi:DNA-binding Lrp family transcriptional regulator